MSALSPPETAANRGGGLSPQSLGWPGSEDQIDPILSFLRDGRLPHVLADGQAARLASDAERLGLGLLTWEARVLWPLRHRAHATRHDTDGAQAQLALGDGLYKAAQPNAAVRKWCRGWLMGATPSLRRELGYVGFCPTKPAHARGLALLHLSAFDRLSEKTSRGERRQNQAFRFWPALAGTLQATFGGQIFVDGVRRLGQPSTAPAVESDVPRDPISGAWHTGFETTRSLAVWVRGTRFVLSPTALDAVAADSAFALLLHDETYLQNDERFLDCDPTSFVWIDQWLHHGTLPWDLDAAALARLQRETEYLGIDGLLTDIRYLYTLRQDIVRQGGAGQKAVATFALGDALYELGQMHGAFDAWHRALSLGSEAEAVTRLRYQSRRKTSRVNRQAWALFHLATLAALKGGPAAARRDAEAALSLNPALDVAWRLLLAARLDACDTDRVEEMIAQRKGADLLFSGDGWQGAAASVEALLANHPQELATWMAKETIAWHAGAGEPHAEVVSQLLKKAPRSAYYQFMLSSSLDDVGETGDRLEQLAQVCCRWPVEQRALLLVASSLLANEIFGSLASVLDVGLRTFPKEDQFVLLQGRAQLAQENWSSAELAFKRLVDRSSHLPDAWINLSEVYAKTGDEERSIEALRMAVAHAGHNQDVLSRCAQRFVEVGLFEEAREAYQKLVEQYPFHHDYRINLAQILLKQEAMQEAFEHAQWVLDEIPRHPGATAIRVEVSARCEYAEEAHELFLAVFSEGEPVSASVLTYLSNALGHEGGTTALAYAQRATEIDAEYIHGWQVLANLARLNGQLELAERATERAKALGPADVLTLQIELNLMFALNNYSSCIAGIQALPAEARTPDIETLLADCFAKTNDRPRAIAHLSQQGELSQGAAELLAQWLYSEADFETLIAHTRRYVSQYRESAQLVEFLFCALFNLDRDEEALLVIRDAVRKDSSSTWRLCHLALVLRYLSQFQESEKWARRAIAIDPGSGGYYQLAQTLLAQGHLASAIAPLEDSLVHEPLHVEVWGVLAQTHKSLGDLASTEDIYRRRLAQDAEDGGTWLSLGQLLAEQTARGREAVVVLRKAAQFAPQRQEALQHACQVLERDKKTMHALVVAQEVLAMVPDDPIAIDRVARLLWARSRYSEAVGLYGRLVTKEPHKTHHRENWAYCLLRSAEHDTARQVYQSRLAEDPDDQKTRTRMALLDLRQDPLDDSYLEGIEVLRELYPLHSASCYEKDVWLAATLRRDDALTRGHWHAQWPLSRGISDKQIVYMAWRLKKTAGERLTSAWCDHALQARPHSARLLFELNELRVWAGDHAAAYHDIERAEQAPVLITKRRAFGFMNAWTELGEYDRSMQWSELVLSRAPRNLRALNTCAFNLDKMQNERSSSVYTASAFVHSGGLTNRKFLFGPLIGNMVENVLIDPSWTVQVRCANRIVDSSDGVLLEPEIWVRALRLSGKAADAAAVADAAVQYMPENRMLLQELCAALLQLQDVPLDNVEDDKKGGENKESCAGGTDT